MFYFDEDHMENGFEAPEVSDHEEDHVISKDFGHCVPIERGKRSSGSGRPAQGNVWPRSRNSGSADSFLTGGNSYSRFSSQSQSGRSSLGRNTQCDLGYDMGHLHTPVGCTLDDLGDCTSESEEQPAELVPLGLRSFNMSGGKSRHRRKKMRNNFNDYYKLTEEHLGSGAYASVRTGVSISTGKEFAIKLVDKHEEGHTRSRIMREVETFNMCKNHPNIVQLHEWFEDADYFYMVFEKMRGGPLLAHIQRKGFFTEQEASKVTRDIASALKYLHDHGIAHRDVKPENVLCSDMDRVSPVKLCDLDLASKSVLPTPPKLDSVNSEPDLASPVGSAEFMAPEVVDAFVGDALKYDKRCDMWSLGVIVYIMICGYPPFYGQCWRENCGWDQGLSCSDCQENLFKRIQRGEFDFPEPEWDTVSNEAKDLISHLLVKNVRDRFTADDVLRHPWIQNGAPETKLQTPGNLIRNDSARDFHQMQENFNAMNRIVAARLSANIGKDVAEELHELSKRGSTSDDEAKVQEEAEKVDNSGDAKALGDNENKKVEQEILLSYNNNDIIGNSFNEINGINESARSMSAPREYTIIKSPCECGITVSPIVHVAAAPVTTATTTAVLRAPQIQQEQQTNPQFQMPNTLYHAVQLPFMDAPPSQMHLPQMVMASPMSYGGPITLGPPQHVSPVSFHPNHVIGVNGFIAYPNAVFPRPLYAQDAVMRQQMFKYGMQPQQFIAPPPSPMVYQSFVNGHQRRSSMQHHKSPKNPYNKAGVNSHKGLLTVQSAAALSELESCQTAMARQDSKSDVRPPARETQVNV